MYIDKVRIEVLAAEQGLTKEALVRKCGMSRSGLFKALRRGACCTVAAGKIAKGLGVSVSDILVKDVDLHRRQV